jgi:hypothetical protein
MTVSPNKPKFPGRAGALFLSLALSVGLSAAALGQGVTTQPLRPPAPGPIAPQNIAPQPLQPLAPAPEAVVPPKPLLPVQSLEPPTRPTSLAPTTAPKSEEGDAAKSRPGLLPVKFDVEALDATDRDSIGTLGDDEGGFGLEMWAGTRRSLVETLLPSVPAQSSSRIMRGLLRRLLLSVAKAPLANVPGEAASTDKASSDQAAPQKPPQNIPPSPQKGLIHLRIERLAAMGDIGAVDALLKVAPDRENDQILLRNEADILFYGNDYARVCPLVASQIRQVATVYWRKAFIFCQALAGEHERASLGVTLLEEQGEEDPVFYNLIDALAGLEKPKIESMGNPRPLHFAMARAAKAKLPGDVISSNHPAVLKTVARTPGLHPELRIDAAERAEAMGALETRILRDLYTSVTFSQEVLENPLTTAESERSPLSRALLYRKALVESIPTAKAGIVSQALTLARDGGRFQSTARVYADVLREFKPSRDLVWFAADVVRALLATGDLETAAAWLDVVRTSAVFDEKSAMLRDELFPLARLAGAVSDDDWAPAVLGAWQNSQRRAENGTVVNEDQVLARSALLYNLLEALGDEVPDRQWEGLLSGPPQRTTVVPRPVFWRNLRNAAVQQRVGETVLLALTALGQAGPTEADPTLLRTVIESLRGVGLGDEARALAIEAAVAAGI